MNAPVLVLAIGCYQLVFDLCKFAWDEVCGIVGTILAGFGLNLFLQLSLVPMPQTSRGRSMELARAQHPTAVDRIHSSVVLSPSCN